MYPSTSCVCNNTRTGIQPTHTHTEKERERGKKGADRMVSIMELFSPSFGWRTENQTRHGTHKRQHLTCWRRLSHTRSFFFYSLVAVLLALDLFRLPDSFSSLFFPPSYSIRVYIPFLFFLPSTRRQIPASSNLDTAINGRCSQLALLLFVSLFFSEQHLRRHNRI